MMKNDKHQIFKIGMSMILLMILADFFHAEPIRANSAEPFLADEWVMDQSADQQQSTESEENQAGEEVAEEDSEIAKIRELISLSKVFYIIIILVLTYFINKYLTLILDNLSEKATNYRLFIKRLAPISRIVIWSFAIYIVIAGVIAPPFETIVAIGASVGIAVGFASQDILKNIFGGIIIILDRPFQVGDKIEVGQHYGEVLNIGLRSCRVVTPDDSVVSIPNAELMNTAVSNTNSSALDCQVVAEIYLPATVDIQKVKQIAYKAVYASSYTFLNKPVVVIVLNELENRHFVYKLRVKAYVVDIRFEFLFKSDLTEMIVDECNKLGMIPPSYVDTVLTKSE
jgi:small-conductance mechanosensitive channel